jgi:cell division protein FtsB
MGIRGLVTIGHARRPSDRRRAVPALLLGGACFVTPLGCALADDTAEDLKQLRAAIQKELADLKKREQKLHQEFLRLDQKSQLLDEQLRKLRAAGAGAPVIATPTPAPAAIRQGSRQQKWRKRTLHRRPPSPCRKTTLRPPRRPREANRLRYRVRPPRSSRPGKSSKLRRHYRVLAAS